MLNRNVRSIPPTMASKEKPKLIVIESAKLTRKDVKITYSQGDSQTTIREIDNPLATFGQAFDALKPLVAVILHLPKDYANESMRIVAIEIGSKGGARTVVIHASKSFDDASKQFEIKTPERLLEKATEEGEYSPVLTDAKCELVWDAIEEARKYVVGERAQGQLHFEEDDGDGDDDGGEEDAGGTPPLPFGDQATPPADAPANKKKNKKKKSDDDPSDTPPTE